MSGYVGTCLWHPATTGLTQQICLWHGWKTMMENWNARTNWGHSPLTYSHAALPTSTTFKTSESTCDPAQDRIWDLEWLLEFCSSGTMARVFSVLLSMLRAVAAAHVHFPRESGRNQDGSLFSSFHHPLQKPNRVFWFSFLLFNDELRPDEINAICCSVASLWLRLLLEPVKWRWIYVLLTDTRW